MAQLAAGENITRTYDPGVGTGGTTTLSVLSETIRDLIALFVTAGAGVTVVHDDVANTLTIAATGPDVEAIHDQIDTHVLVGAGITKVVNDVANTLTLTLDEDVVQATILTTILAGYGVAVTPDAVSGAITISTIGSAAGLPDPTTTKGDLLVRTTNPAGNYALSSLGAFASASSAQATFGAANAIDGNGATAWASLADTLEDWLAVDLGSQLTVISSTILAKSDLGHAACSLQSSPDSVTWTTRQAVAAQLAAATTTYPITPVTARYWRLYWAAGAATAQGVATLTLDTAAFDSVKRLGVGANGLVLTADSAEASGVKWFAIPAGATTLDGLTDVVVNSPADGHVVRHDGTTFVNAPEYVTANFVIDGGGSAVTTGIKGDMVIDHDFYIESVTLLADQTGSIAIDLQKDTYANFPPVVGDSITAAAKPTLATAIKAQDATLTGWTRTGAAGDIIRFVVDSAATLTRCTVSLRLRRLS